MLCTSDGWYRHGFFGLLLNSRSLVAEIEADFRDQFERILGVCRADHVNGHMHCHAIPAIFDIACRLAHEYGVPYIRVPDERPALANGDYPWMGLALNAVKSAALVPIGGRLRQIADRYGVATNGAFVGLLYTGFMDEASVRAGLSRARTSGRPVELLLHPCSEAGRTEERYWPGIRDYAMSRFRARELLTITNHSLANRLRSEGWTFTNYSTLAGRPTPNPPSPHTPTSTQRLRVVAVLDETPFYQPQYLYRLAVESAHAEIVAVARVVQAGGGIVPRYMIRNWRRLGLREFTALGLKQVWLQAKGWLPHRLRGTHEGSVASVTRRLGIVMRTISSVRSSEFQEWMRSLEPDVILSSNSLIFPKALLEIPRLGVINRHSALLPSYGGILPVFRAVQKGESSVGVSVHLMTEEIDRGPVLTQRRIPIEPQDTLDVLYGLAFTLSVDATEEAFRLLQQHGRNAPAIPSNGRPSYYSFPTPDDWKEFRAHGGRFI